MLNDFVKEKGLFGFEKVRKIYLHSRSFLSDDLLTSTYKLKRHTAREFF